MTIDAPNIELFKNLAIWDIEDVYYDFHNDFICTTIHFHNETLIINFKNRKEQYPVSLSFLNTSLSDFEFANSPVGEELVIDLLYRGRFEEQGQLLETAKSGHSYFYLEFYDEQKLEFFSNAVVVEENKYSF